MSDIGLSGRRANPPGPGLCQRLLRLAASRGFQTWAARFPLTRGITRREGQAMFDLVAGFVHSQCLAALVEFRVLHLLMDGPLGADDLADRTSVPVARLRVLLDAGAALGLIARRGETYRITLRGAAMTGVPGLEDMIRHHAVLYRDLGDPGAFFRGETETGLAAFWPYVFGAGAAEDPEIAARYSRLMSDSQALVAEETLAAVSFAQTRHLMDVGGGTGAFLAAALQTAPQLRATLFDLPAVVPAARARFAEAGLADRIAIVPGSFRDDPLPRGADTISLVRVLYDHQDATVAALLAAVFDALPSGGRLVVSEPMTGGAQPAVPGDTYFAVYTLAMGTGRTRSADEIAAAMRAAGFSGVQSPRTARPFVTSVVTGKKT